MAALEQRPGVDAAGAVGGADDEGDPVETEQRTMTDAITPTPTGDKNNTDIQTSPTDHQQEPSGAKEASMDPTAPPAQTPANEQMRRRL
jgi:hypothetical protein